jgi:diguanylate cyclase (GGDEF)-like protein
MNLRSSAAPTGPERADGAMGVIDRFVHPSLRQNPDLLYRTRTLIGLLLTFAAIFVLADLILLLIPLPRLNLEISLGMSLLSFLGTCALLEHLRRHGSYQFCSMAAGMLIQAMTVASIVLSGGIMQAPPVAQMLVIPPLLAYFFGGVRGGNASLGLLLLVICILVAAERNGVHFPQTISSTYDRRTIRLLVSFVNVMFVSAIAFAYELTARKLKSERDREHRKVLALSKRDALTGLANRRSLEAGLSKRVEACCHSTPPRPFVVCCVDLDGFKPINDRYGHKVGDEVLRVIAERLRLSFRGNDIVGRQGGDEFMAIFDAAGCLPNAEGASVELLAERMVYMIGKPIDTSAGSLQVGASLGFAFYPRDGSNADSLKRAADAAMYEAKGAGGSAWRFFNSSALPAKAAGSSAPSDLPALDDAADQGDPASLQAGAAEADREPKAWPIALLDALLHPALRLDTAIMNRARILAAALLLICVLLVGTVAALALTPIPAGPNRVGITIALSVLVVSVLLLVLLRRSGNYFLCSVATLLFLHFVVLAATGITGGAAAGPVAQAMAVLPLVAYFFGGTRLGTGMVIGSLASIMAFALLEMIGFRFYTSLDEAAARVSYLMVCLLCLFFTSGIAFAYVFVARNLQRERDLEHRLVEHLAQTDDLTGLANRMKFDSELSARIAQASVGEASSPFTLCYLDLDGFKPINDRYGHYVGDEVLQAVSERLRGCIREGDSVGRHGGDEFILLFNSVKSEAEVALIARRLLQAIAPPMLTRAGILSVRGSLGFAIFPFDGVSEDALKAAADRAMYLAKGQGGGWSHRVAVHGG